jgi:uncharacterized protein YceK
MKTEKILAVLGLGVLCSGCGTVVTHLIGANGVYQGVRLDCGMIAQGNFMVALDVPLSAAGDTLLLPVDLANPSDPLRKGWSFEPNGSVHLNREIVEDYEDFIRKLNLQKAPVVHFYADKAGRHAVTIILETEWKWIHYTLVYDRSNVRTKVVKWTEGRIRGH